MKNEKRNRFVSQTNQQRKITINFVFDFYRDKIEDLPLSTQKIIDNILMSTLQKIEADEKIQIYEDSQTKKLEEEKEKEKETKLEKDVEFEKVQRKEVVIEVEHDKSGDVILEDAKMKKETKKSFGQESAGFNSVRNYNFNF